MTEGVVPVGSASADLLSAGKEALGRHAWQEAFDLLSSADREGRLTGSDLET